MGLLEQIFEAGVVGAGGAGFPTHKKLTKDADTLIVNAAECEPLLASDRYVMRHFAPQITEALLAVQKEFGYKRVIIGTKKKYTREIEAFEKAFKAQGANFEIFGVGSFYPAGDEQVLIYEITGQTVPPGGIPLALGIVVINVTTALAIHDAMQGKAVTEKYVTVTGEVGQPVIVRVPVGTSVADCVAAAGGPRVNPFAIVKGGPMMGPQYTMDKAEELRIGKADGGIILLQADHPLIEFARRPVESMINQAKSVCIQCNYCTEMCPRFLIGHKMRPHRVMRSVATGTNATDLTDALLCCECGICELYACPMLLSPRRMNIYVKGLLREQGIGVSDKTVYADQTATREYRRIAQSRFINRLSLTGYPTGVDDMIEYTPDRVFIPLKHGVGKPSSPVVKPGDTVKKGDLVARVDFGDVGCLVHASIDGTVTSVDGGIAIERKGGDR